jgi:hypothetical protein
MAARQDLIVASGKLRSMVSKAKAEGTVPLALMMIGSMERGNKVFRYQSCEAGQLYSQLKLSDMDQTVPVAGLYSGGAFARLQGGIG